MKSALINGASKGIGHELALLIAKNGWLFPGWQIRSRNFLSGLSREISLHGYQE
jgi:short-subunit dehydrogenase